MPDACPVHLTPREIAIARLLARDKTDKRIAADLGIGIRTVQSHIERVALKIRAETSGRSRRLAIARFSRRYLGVPRREPGTPDAPPQTPA